jgi:hypothetical protein
MALQALKSCGEVCEDLKILLKLIESFETKEFVGNGQSRLPLSTSQPAAAERPRASRLARQSNSRLPQSKIIHHIHSSVLCAIAIGLHFIN